MVSTERKEPCFEQGRKKNPARHPLLFRPEQIHALLGPVISSRWDRYQQDLRAYSEETPGDPGRVRHSSATALLFAAASATGAFLFFRFFSFTTVAGCGAPFHFFLIAIAGCRALLLFPGANCTGFGAASAAGFRLLGLDDASSVGAAASAGGRWSRHDQAGTGHETGNTETGKHLLQILLFHTAPPLVKVDRTDNSVITIKRTDNQRPSVYSYPAIKILLSM